VWRFHMSPDERLRLGPNNPARGEHRGDCAERLRRGDRIGLTGRLEQDEYRRPGGAWQVDHAVLSDQLDLPPETTKDEEEQ